MPTKKHASDFESLPLFQTSNNGIPKKLITSSDLKPINNLKTVFHELEIILLEMLLESQGMKPSHKTS